ncbi:MAG: hypothetical protein IIB38_16935, partial [Candidatus Hydrogenedentes bacterium]|nr:hypothetical protein [Candidatus Hydrogenedentota bacterium]
MRSEKDTFGGYWGCIALLLSAVLAAPVSVAQERGPGVRPQSGAVATQPISIHFEDVPLLTVIESIGAQTGKNFDVDASVSSQRVTIISHKPVAPELAYSILESILSSRNYVMVETVDGNLVKVVPRDRERDKLTVNTGRDVPLVGYDTVVIQVVHVEYANAEDVASILAATGSEDNHIDVYTQTNTLVIRDTADGLRNMFKLLEVIDVPGQNVSLEIFTLRYTRAEALIQQIQEVLLDDGTSRQQRPPVPTPAQRARAARPGGGSLTQVPNVVGQRERVLRMVPDERLNALIVVA